MSMRKLLSTPSRCGCDCVSNLDQGHLQASWSNEWNSSFDWSAASLWCKQVLDASSLRNAHACSGSCVQPVTYVHYVHHADGWVSSMQRTHSERISHLHVAIFLHAHIVMVTAVDGTQRYDSWVRQTKNRVGTLIRLMSCVLLVEL